MQFAIVLGSRPQLSGPLASLALNISIDFQRPALANFEPKLLRLFDGKLISADVRTFFITQSVKTLDDLATFIDNQSEVQVEILDNVASAKADAQQRFRLKQAWRFAHDEYERRSSRRQQGWAEDAMDEPLGPDDTKERYTTFVTSYKLHLRPWDKGSNMLLGRVTRESEKWTMTFMPLEKVRDLKNTQVLSSTKRQKLTDDVDLLTRNPEEEEAPITSPMPYLHGLRVYCTTLAVGGNRKVVSKADGTGTEVCYAPLSDMFNHFSLAEEKTHTHIHEEAPDGWQYIRMPMAPDCRRGHSHQGHGTRAYGAPTHRGRGICPGHARVCTRVGHSEGSHSGFH